MLAAACALAPYIEAELWRWRNPHDVIAPAPAVIAKGRMHDDYFVVQPLGANSFAIGEPRYYQANYAYLIVGTRRALLFDAGSGTRDIRPVVASLTKLPVTVIASHLHFDHFGGIGVFDSIAMIDLEETRARMSRGRFTPGRYEFLGMFDDRPRPSVRIAEWWKPGTRIDLGGRSILVQATPGHTMSSVTLYDDAARRLFTGDFLYPTTLYAFLPGASLSAYHRSARRLLDTLPADTTLWSAHCCRNGDGMSAPWLSMRDLKDFERALTLREAGRLTATGLYPRNYPVNRQMELATGFRWNNR